jgi:hypothetical protein
MWELSVSIFASLPSKPLSAVRLYKDEYVEVVLIVFRRLPSRKRCMEITRNWKEKRLIRPVLIFTDNIFGGIRVL